MKRLTISADEAVIEEAKKLAEEQATSVSAMFERFVRILSKRRDAVRSIGPVARKASGVITMPKGKTDRQILEDALSEKHGIEP